MNIASNTSLPESFRLKLQGQLDAAKTQEERNRLSQFATPTALATEILACARSLLSENDMVRFLDPAFCTGSFYSALNHVFRVYGGGLHKIEPAELANAPVNGIMQLAPAIARTKGKQLSLFDD